MKQGLVQKIEQKKDVKQQSVKKLEQNKDVKQQLVKKIEKIVAKGQKKVKKGDWKCVHSRANHAHMTHHAHMTQAKLDGVPKHSAKASFKIKLFHLKKDFAEANLDINA